MTLTCLNLPFTAAYHFGPAIAGMASVISGYPAPLAGGGKKRSKRKTKKRSKVSKKMRYSKKRKSSTKKRKSSRKRRNR